MYLLLTDETNMNSSEDVKFFAYGGLFFPIELIPELNAAIKLIRNRYGIGPQYALKFNTNSRPTVIDAETHKKAKNDILQLCIDMRCRFIAYVVHHRISETGGCGERFTFAADHVLNSFHNFLVESDETGIVLMDTPPFANSDSFMRKKFEIGLDFPSKGTKTALDRIHLYGTTGIGMSNISSLIDICLGSFRYCINNPQSQSAAQALFKNVLKIMWCKELAGGKRTVRERGLILRPADVKNANYRRDYDSLIGSLRKYAGFES